MVVREYAKARGFDAGQAEAYALRERARFWTRYRRKHPVEFKLEL